MRGSPLSAADPAPNGRAVRSLGRALYLGLAQSLLNVQAAHRFAADDCQVRGASSSVTKGSGPSTDRTDTPCRRKEHR